MRFKLQKMPITSALDLILLVVCVSNAFAKIVEVSPVQMRYYLNSKIELEAIPNYDIEDEGTSPTKKIFNLTSVLFSRRYDIGDYPNFDSKEYVISYNFNKSAKDQKIRKLAETINANEAGKRNGIFRHENKSKILYRMGIIMANIGFEKGNFRYETNPEKYYQGRDHRPEWYIYIPYNFHHPYVIPTNLPVGKYKIPIISIVRDIKRDGKSPIKLLDLNIDNIQKDGDKSIISWHIPETELGIYEKMNSKSETLFYQEFFSAEGQITCDSDGVIQKYHTRVHHDLYLNRIHVENYHRISKGKLLNEEFINDTRKFNIEDEGEKN